VAYLATARLARKPDAKKCRLSAEPPPAECGDRDPEGGGEEQAERDPACRREIVRDILLLPLRASGFRGRIVGFGPNGSRLIGRRRAAQQRDQVLICVLDPSRPPAIDFVLRIGIAGSGRGSPD
jgi:hypothetical protein